MSLIRAGQTLTVASEKKTEGAQGRGQEDGRTSGILLERQRNVGGWTSHQAVQGELKREELEKEFEFKNRGDKKTKRQEDGSSGTEAARFNARAGFGANRGKTASKYHWRERLTE